MSIGDDSPTHSGWHNGMETFDTYVRQIEDKTIQDEAPPHLESFISHESQVSIYHIEVLFVSFTNKTFL